MNCRFCVPSVGYVCLDCRGVQVKQATICKNCGEEIYYGTSSNATLMALKMDDTVDWYHVRTGTVTCRIMIAEPKE